MPAPTLDRLLPGWYSLADFGADAQGNADAAPALLAGLRAVDAAGGGRLIVPRGTYSLGSTLSFRGLANVVLELAPGATFTGPGGLPTPTATCAIADTRGGVLPGQAPPWTWLPTGWNATFRAALAASANSPAWLGVLGDSTTWGGQATDNTGTTWVAVLRAALVARYGLGGDFWPLFYSSEAAVVAGATYDGTPPWSAVTATGRSFSGTANGLGSAVFWSGSTGSATFTAPVGTTRIDLISIDFANGSWTYSVDGGSAVTVTVTGAGSTWALRRTTITGLAAASQHTVVVTQTATSPRGLLQGALAYANPNAGVGFGWHAMTGQRLAQFVNTNWPTDGTLTWGGGSAVGATGFGFPTQPHLLCIAMGINECQNFGTYCLGPNGFERALQRLVQGYRRGRANGSVLLLGMSMPDGVASDVQTGAFDNSQNWPRYLARMQRVAEEFGCGFVNIHARWGELGVSNGYQTDADPHPTDAGHGDIAAAVLAAL